MTSDKYITAKNKLLTLSRKDLKTIAENILWAGYPVSSGFYRAMQEVLKLRNMHIAGWNKDTDKKEEEEESVQDALTKSMLDYIHKVKNSTPRSHDSLP